MKIKKQDVMYHITNTQIPVTLTHTGYIYFDYSTDDLNDMVDGNIATASDCLQKKMRNTIEYIKSEGFINDETYNAMISVFKKN